VFSEFAVEAGEHNLERQGKHVERPTKCTPQEGEVACKRAITSAGRYFGRAAGPAPGPAQLRDGVDHPVL